MGINQFVSSDHHFFHKNILKYQITTRPFSSVDEMNEQIIIRHNEVVNEDDEVYFLGDFAFTKDVEAVVEILRSMNGTKHFIFGNHDHVMRNPSIKNEFVWMRNYHELKIKGMSPIPLFHYPIYSWNRMAYGSFHFYGHTHGQIPHLFHGKGTDVGLDTNNCYPWNINDIFERYERFEEDENIDPRYPNNDGVM